MAHRCFWPEGSRGYAGSCPQTGLGIPSQFPVSCSVYLLGSVHFLKKEHYPLAAPIEAAFERARIAVLETDIEAMEKPEFQASLLSKATLPPGQTLKDQLSPKLHERLSSQLNETGLPIDALKNFKPGMVAMTIAMVEMQKLGLDPKLGLDQHFHQRAKKVNKDIVGLEEPQFQVDLITGFIVGTAHLAGKDSVIEMLEKNGTKVAQQ